MFVIKKYINLMHNIYITFEAVDRMLMTYNQMVKVIHRMTRWTIIYTNVLHTYVLCVCIQNMRRIKAFFLNLKL